MRTTETLVKLRVAPVDTAWLVLFACRLAGAFLVAETVYPSRDAYHREIILKANGFTEESLRGD